jgi:hypothetical protein
MNFLLVATAALVGTITVSGQLSIIPISSNEYSYQRGNSDSAVKVELYIDLTCRYPSLTSVKLILRISC